jgi:hypothetical protein
MVASQVWNTIDAEYGTFNWLRREVCVRLGYNADHRLLNRTERAYVDSLIESGVMQFCNAAYPSAMQMEDSLSGEGRAIDSMQVEATKEAKRRPPHNWSFLHKIHDITTINGVSNYEMPDDFGAWIGEPTTSRAGGKIAIVRENHIRQLQTSDPQSGGPKYCATRQTSIGGTRKLTTEIVFYPTPDAGELIQIEYKSLPEGMSDTSQYPPGGREHAETVLASCFYVLSQRTSQGIEAAIIHYRDRLAASIIIDNSSAKPTSDGIWVDDDGRFNAAYLSRMVGRHLGAGPNPSAWSHGQEQMIAECLRRAQRKVYNPPVLPSEKYPHDWSFLRPVSSIRTRGGVYAYDLPNDFAQLYGPLTHASADSTLYPSIRFVGEHMIRQLLQRQESSARPDRAAVRVKEKIGDEPTRYELILWPTPDDEYTIEFRYRVNPDTSGYNSLPALVDAMDLHGGDRFSEMFLEAAFLSADELMGVKRSPHDERFIRAVINAVGSDRLTSSPDSMGYNGDPSMGRSFNGDWHEYDENTVSYNGNLY